MINRDFRKVKNISKEMEEYYVKYFIRNAGKFFSKWRFTENDLNTTFSKEGEEYALIGQSTDAQFVLKKTDDESKWFVSGDFLAKEFERKN